MIEPECRLDLLGIFVVGIEKRCAQTLYLIRHTKTLTYLGGTSSLQKYAWYRKYRNEHTFLDVELFR